MKKRPIEPPMIPATTPVGRIPGVNDPSGPGADLSASVAAVLDMLYPKQSANMPTLPERRR